VPIVLCATSEPTNTYASVDINHEKAALDAVTLLLNHGHRQIGFISGSFEDTNNGLARFNGYKKALESAGMEIKDELVRIGNQRYESGIDATKYFLGLGERPSAIFSATDEMAIGAIHAIQDFGLRVPHDISVVGIDNIRMASMVRPQLTTVAQPMYDLGAVSMRLLTKLMNKEKVEDTRVILSHEVITRNSLTHVYK
jgi:LacI family transcriptional regulator